MGLTLQDKYSFWLATKNRTHRFQTKSKMGMCLDGFQPSKVDTMYCTSI